MSGVYALSGADASCDAYYDASVGYDESVVNHENLVSDAVYYVIVLSGYDESETDYAESTDVPFYILKKKIGFGKDE